MNEGRRDLRDMRLHQNSVKLFVENWLREVWPVGQMSDRWMDGCMDGRTDGQKDGIGTNNDGLTN